MRLRAVSSAIATAPLRLVLPVLFGLTLIAYHDTFSVPFVLDDIPAIAANPALEPLWPPTSDLWSNPAGGVTTTGRPLTAFTFALNHAVHGFALGGYHAVNLGLHLLNGLLLLLLLRRVIAPTSSPWFAPAVTALWLVHPLNTAAVTYVSQRAELLGATAILAALWSFARGVNGNHRRWFGVTAFVCALGMLAKETVVVAPLLILLLDRTCFAASWREVFAQRARWHALFACTWLVLLALALSTAGRGDTAGLGAGITSFDYLCTQAVAIAGYVRRLVWPTGLIFDYGTAIVRDPARFIAPLLFVVGLVGVAVWRWLRDPRSGLPWVAFFFLLAPSSSLIPIATQTIAEHRMLLPSAALLIALVTLLGTRIPLRWQPWVLLTLVVALTTVTVARNHDYRSAVSLWRDTVEKRPSNPRAHHNLALALLAEDAPQPALAAIDAALALDDQNAETHYNRGLILARSNRPADAQLAYERALEIEARHAESANNLGNLLLADGSFAAARRWHQLATEQKPKWPEAWRNLALSSLATGESQAALLAAQRATQLRPDWPDAQFTLAQCLATIGDTSAALGSLDRVLELQPDHIPALQASISLLAQSGNLREAERRARVLQKLTPDDPRVPQMLRSFQQSR